MQEIPIQLYRKNEFEAKFYFYKQLYYTILGVQFFKNSAMGYATETSTLLVCGGYFVSKFHQ